MFHYYNVHLRSLTELVQLKSIEIVARSDFVVRILKLFVFGFKKTRQT